MRWVTALLLATTACVTAKPAPEPTPPPPPPPAPTARPNAVRTRATPFDVSACAKPPALRPLTADTLAAFLEFERPRFDACLASPTSREKADASADVEVSVTATVSAKVTPRSVSPEGVTCLEGAARQLGLSGGATAVVGRVVAAPPAGAPDPSVVLLPEVSALRAAVTSACVCFEGLGANAPPQLVLTDGPTAAIDVVTASDPLATKLERCLEQALASHPRSSVELTVDLPLLSGDANQPSPEASADVVSLQEATMRRRRLARVKLLVAQRAAVMKQLEPLSISLKRKPTPTLIKQRKNLCGVLFELEDALPGALELVKDEEAVKAISAERSQLCSAVKRASDEAE